MGKGFRVWGFQDLGAGVHKVHVDVGRDMSTVQARLWALCAQQVMVPLWVGPAPHPLTVDDSKA